MKAKIIEIIGYDLMPKIIAECKADDIIDLFVGNLRKAYFDGMQAGLVKRYRKFNENDYLS